MGITSTIYRTNTAIEHFEPTDDLVVSKQINNLLKNSLKSKENHSFDSEKTSSTLNNSCHKNGKVNIKSHILGQQS